MSWASTITITELCPRPVFGPVQSANTVQIENDRLAKWWLPFVVSGRQGKQHDHLARLHLDLHPNDENIRREELSLSMNSDIVLLNKVWPHLVLHGCWRRRVPLLKHDYARRAFVRVDPRAKCTFANQFNHRRPSNQTVLTRIVHSRVITTWTGT